MAAGHIPLALYLHHRDLQLPVSHLRTARIAVAAPEAWVETAPDKVADYLRFKKPFGRQKGTPYPLRELLSPELPPPPTQLRHPEGMGFFLDTHLTGSSEAANAQMGPAVQRACIRGLETCLREAHRWHNSAPWPPRRQEGSPAVDACYSEKVKTSQVGPPARPPPGRGTPTGTPTQPHCTKSLPKPRRKPPATPSATPSATAVPLRSGTAPTPPEAHHTGTAARKSPRHSRRARERGTTSGISMPPQPRIPAHLCPYTTASPTSSITTTPEHSQGPQVIHLTRRTGPHHTLTCTRDTPPTTTVPCHSSHQCYDATHSRHTLTTTTTRSSTSCHPH